MAAEPAIEDCLPVGADRFEKGVFDGLGLLVASIELAAALGLAEMEPIASEAQTDKGRQRAFKLIGPDYSYSGLKRWTNPGVESPGGISPPGALRTGRARLHASASSQPPCSYSNCQCANRPWSRRAMRRSHWSARHLWPRKRLYFCVAPTSRVHGRYAAVWDTAPISERCRNS